MSKSRSATGWAAGLAGMMLVSAGFLNGCKPAGPAAANLPPLPVVAAEVLVRDQPIYAEFIGQTFGSQDVDVRARVEGFLQTVNFASGQPVKRGDLLYTIDDQPFKSALAQAQGQLAQAQAAWTKTQRDTNRLGPLWLQNAISRQQFDDARSAEENAAAVYQSAQANVDSAQIQLGYTKIYSPLDGLAGENKISEGNLVGRGESTLLTTISTIDPITVKFSVSEQQYLDWKRKLGPEADSHAPDAGLLQLILADGTVSPRRGDVTFADRQVDPRTGTLQLEASFPNPDQLIRPGQFCRVRIPLEVVTNAVLIPQRAVTELQATYSVYVVGADNTAQFRKVSPGPRVGTYYVISSGLQAGDKVILDGIQKLQNNTPIAPAFTNLVTGVDATTITE